MPHVVPMLIIQLKTKTMYLQLSVQVLQSTQPDGTPEPLLYGK